MLIYICFVLFGLQTFLPHLILLGKSLILSCFVVEETEAHRGYVLAKLFQLIHGDDQSPNFYYLHAASPGGSCENVLDITLSLVSGNYNSGIYKGKKQIQLCNALLSPISLNYYLIKSIWYKWGYSYLLIISSLHP